MSTFHMIECQLRGIPQLLRNSCSDSYEIHQIAMALERCRAEIMEVFRYQVRLEAAKERQRRERDEPGGGDAA